MARLLYLIDSLDFGGAERQLSLLLKYLPTTWKTGVVSLGGGPYHQVLLDQKTLITVCQRRSRFDLLPIIQLYSEILRYQPDIIHSWGGLCSALVAPICKILSIIFIEGSIRIGGEINRHIWRSKMTFSLSDQIVSNNFAGLSANRIPTEKGIVIYNAIDPDRLELLIQSANDQKEITTVIMTGRISSDKDFVSFFQAARCLSAKQPGGWRFVAIGAGEEKDRRGFMKLAEDLVVDGVVDLPHAGLEVLPYLQEADIGVLLSDPCIKEGFSNSIMEYMVCKLPVICTESGGNRELVVDGETGFVIPSDNIDSLIEKLLFLKEHPEISNRMGKAGYKRVISLCSIERMIKEYETLYIRLLGAKDHRKYAY
jgi:glycosyltransferase involved in cell wall biosynthesis